jgi:hypothetical protein
LKATIHMQSASRREATTSLPNTHIDQIFDTNLACPPSYNPITT